MGATPTAESAALTGAWVADVRRRKGLTARDLGSLTGLRLWDIERLETGRPAPAGAVERIAEATGMPVPGLATAGAAVEAPAAPAAHRARERVMATLPDDMAVRVVLGSLIFLIVVRFFTEKVHVLPGAANFVDVPLFFTLLLATILVRPSGERRSFGLARPAAAFIVLCVISVLVNIQRVDPAPALMFVYGFLGPIVVFWAVHRIWPPGNALTFSRLLVGLGIVQLLTVVTMDLPKFLGSGNNPDVISGTFGENAYQLVFFLLVLVALLSGINSFERERLIVKVIPVFLVAIFAIIVLAQYRALLVTTALTVIGLGAVLSIGRPRAFILTLVTVGALVMALSYVSQAFPRLRLGQTISDFGNNPTLYLTERVKIMDDIWRLYGDNPRYVLTGTGPGTYSSRAWEVFASDSQLQTSSAGVLASKLLGGRPYSTDVSEKYVVPRLSKVVSGSHAITNPRATWPSLFGEVGVPGAMMIMILYALLLVAVLRRVLVCLRTRRSGDPVPALLLAGGTAIFVLLQMGSLQNWLEVARVTFLAAAIVAVAIKEFDAAHPAEA